MTFSKAVVEFAKEFLLDLFKRLGLVNGKIGVEV